MNLGIAVKEPWKSDFLPESNRGYVHLLSLMMQNHWESIALGKHGGGSPKSARTLDHLSRHIPRKYLLELQFCLAAYGSVFATLFPPMLSHLDNLPYIEWLLHMETDHEKYRDHLVHMFRVAFVCNRLMQIKAIYQKAGEFQFSSEHFVGWCKERLNTDPGGWDTTRKDRILCAAIYLCAIFHDVGYGYYFLSQYRQRLAGVLPVLTQGEATADIHHKDVTNIRNSLGAKYATKYHHSLQENESAAKKEVILSGFFRDNLGLNHSVASGLFLVDLADNLYDRHAISDELYVAFHLAAEAAMLHDMRGNDKRLHLSSGACGELLDFERQREVPISTLLCFADNLELGNRPRFRKEIEDEKCTFCMDNREGDMIRMKFDKSRKCLTIEPRELINKNNFSFIFDSEKACYVLFDIPINKSDSNS